MIMPEQYHLKVLALGQHAEIEIVELSFQPYWHALNIKQG